MRQSSGSLLVGLVLLASGLTCFSGRTMAQQKKVSEEPLQIVDAVTGKMIREVLVIPRLSTFKGTSTMMGEGPGGGTHSDSLAKPFIYNPGAAFSLKLPKSAGFVLPGFLFIGKGKSLQGILLVAPGYRTRWFASLWSNGAERRVQLEPISHDEWTALVETKLRPLNDTVVRMDDECGFWDLPRPCTLGIRFSKKERELVRQFLSSSQPLN